MEHDAIPVGEIHAPHNWVVADEAARLALVVTEADLGKYCWQRDNESQWFLTAHDPATWQTMETTVAWGDITGKPDLIEEGDSRLTDSRTPTGGAGGVLSGSYPNPGFAVDMATQGEVDTQVTLLYTALGELDEAKADAVPGKGLSTEDYSTAEKTKLAGIATGATANSSDATLLDRSNHTGTQLASTISDFAATVRATVLAGLSTATNAAITAADTILTALGKLQAQIAGHTSASSGAHAASAISNTPAGNIAATTVQAAINELDGEKQAALVSGTNIKTAGGQNLVGSGDAPIVAPETTAASSKSTPVDADYVPVIDSAASNALKKLTWANIKATLFAYFQGLFREKLTAARTYYVRSDGSDSNDGLANTSGGAFLTLQKAIDVASALDNSGYDITIQLGDATRTSGITLKSFVGSGRIIIAGNSSTPANTAFSLTTGNVFVAVCVIGRYEIQYLSMSTAASGNIIDATGSPTNITLRGCIFGAVGSASAHVSARNGAFIDFTSAAYTINGGGGYHIFTSGSGIILCNTLACTISGTPAFAIAFAAGSIGGITRAVSVTWSGSATGVRYAVATGGMVQVGGAGGTYLPGNSAGTNDGTGIYA